MTDSVNNLSSYYTNIIDAIMTVERQPLTRYQTQQDEMKLHRTAYTDLSARLDALQNAVKALDINNPLNLLAAGRKINILPSLPNTTIATANSTSNTIPGVYDLSVTHLAQAERHASVVQSSVDQSLGKSGNIWLGGNGSASAAISEDAGILLDGVSNAAVTAGLNELGTGSYRVETREIDGKTQFRLRDADGNAVTVDDVNDTGKILTSSWQNIPAGGTFNTGRGLVLNMNETSGSAAMVNYTAAGVQVTIDPGDTLVGIANKINDTLQPIGHNVAASVVGTQLVLTAAATGDHHTMIYSADASLGFGFTETQAARAATFSLNGIQLTRQSNTNLTDVISGLTLENLAPDAEPTGTDPRRATIEVKTDNSTARAAIQTFVDKFNDAQSYIEKQTSITKVNDTTYTRGTLSNDTIFGDLRSTMFDLVMNENSNSGAFKFLNQIGISIDSSLQVSISDSEKLDQAISTGFNDVTALLGSVMTKFQKTLSGFTGSSGYLTNAVNTFDNESKDLAATIADLNTNLADRRASLVDQYGQMQAMLYTLSYQQQTFTAIYNSMSALT